MSTYTPIASVTLDSAQPSVTFSGIPQTYTDLVFVCEIDGDDGGASTRIRFNSDSGSNYSQTDLRGNGSSATSNRTSSVAQISLGVGAATNQTNVIGSINNYSNSTTYKTVLLRTNNPAEFTAARVGLWRNTNAITSIEFFVSAGNWVAGSTFNIYGVNAQLSAQAKAYGGDTIVTDGTYWYHTFLSSGTFTPTQALTADYLVVAGGGGGGVAGGGGGAGGYRYFTSQSLNAGTLCTVTVGAGGAGSAGGSPYPTGASGVDSVFSSITSAGGGGGGGYGKSGVSGGSGGGTGADNNASTAGNGNTPSTSPSQGNNGGVCSVSGTCGAGGGGGASGVGGNGTATTSGAGGAGTANSISGSSVTYAVGGGTRTFAPLGAGDDGAANTGNGGQGSDGSGAYKAGNGGSGIVIVRYAVQGGKYKWQLIQIWQRLKP